MPARFRADVGVEEVIRVRPVRVERLDEKGIRRARSGAQRQILLEPLVEIAVAQPPAVAAVLFHVGAVLAEPAQILDDGALRVRADQVFDAAERTIAGEHELQRVAAALQHLEDAQRAGQERLVVAVVVVPDRQQQRQPEIRGRHARRRPGRAAHLAEAFEMEVVLLQPRQLRQQRRAHDRRVVERVFHGFHVDHQQIALGAGERPAHVLRLGHGVEQRRGLELAQNELSHADALFRVQREPRQRQRRQQPRPAPSAPQAEAAEQSVQCRDCRRARGRGENEAAQVGVDAARQRHVQMEQDLLHRHPPPDPAHQRQSRYSSSRESEDGGQRRALEKARMIFYERHKHNLPVECNVAERLFILIPDRKYRYGSQRL